MRNSPLTNQRLTEILQNTYQKLLDESDWNDKKFPKTMNLTAPFTPGATTPEHKLPTDFSSIEDGTGQFDGEYTFEIMEADDVLFYSDANNRDSEKAYFTIVESDLPASDRLSGKFLVFQYGKAPTKSISFVWIAQAEKITDSILDKKPKYIHPDFQDLLIYGLARDSFMGRNLDTSEVGSLRMLEQRYSDRLAQYQYFNNQ